MVRHLLAPVSPRLADSLGLARTLERARAQNAVTLTFDDGPHPRGTARILDILAEHGARAVFFVIGENVIRHPEIAQRILEEGHAIGLHGHVHRLQLRRRPQALAEDYARGIDAIHHATRVRPTRHRPPYGIYSPAGLRIARQAGLEPLLWSRWGKDWRKYTTGPRIASRAAEGIAPGDVILLHDADFYSARNSHERTAAALPVILARLKRAGVGTVLSI
jgi:peptidoglycan/xylan/chitin deacetylase (PgdA/CDA1 family)